MVIALKVHNGEKIHNTTFASIFLDLIVLRSYFLRLSQFGAIQAIFETILLTYSTIDDFRFLKVTLERLR